nr:unnamed protein product [Digitaria exilis]
MLKKLRRGTPRLDASSVVQGLKKSETTQVGNVALDGGAEEGHGAVVAHHVGRVDAVVAGGGVVGALGQAGGGVVEGELGEPDGEARRAGGIDRVAYALGRGHGRGDGAERAVGGQKQRRVDGRDQVAVLVQRDEHEVGCGPSLYI